jgi:hypothetical protein
MLSLFSAGGVHRVVGGDGCTTGTMMRIGVYICGMALLMKHPVMPSTVPLSRLARRPRWDDTYKVVEARAHRPIASWPTRKRPMMTNPQFICFFTHTVTVKVK